MRARRDLCLGVLLVLACTSAALAQDAPEEPAAAEVAGEAEPEASGEPAIERLLLDDVTTRTEPEPGVDLYFRALTRVGLPVRGLRSSDLEVWQDTERIAAEDVRLDALRAGGTRIGAVVVMDASGSMKGEAFAHAKDAALALLELMDPQDPVAVLTFADEVAVVANFGEARSDARRALRTLELDPAKGQRTKLYDGVHRALELIRTTPTVPRRSFVIVLSDGEDDASEKTADEVVALANGVEDDPPILLFAVGYVGRTREESAGFLQRLAERTGGDFLRADSAAHIQDFFDAIAAQVLASYVVRFPAELDGAKHQVKLNVAGRSATRDVVYPDLGGSLWPMLGALAAAALLVGIGVGLYTLRSGASVGRLEVLSGSSAGTVVRLKPGRTRIGACDDNELVLPGTTVSRYHAEIVARGKRVEIEDLRSTNGTFVNGGAVQKKQALRPGDRIAIADVELRFER